MWHPDINPEFYSYACDVLARHGEASLCWVNYDLMREAELRSGIPRGAWEVVYSGPVVCILNGILLPGRQRRFMP